MMKIDNPDEIIAMGNLGILPVCFDCPHIERIHLFRLYRCHHHAFNRIKHGECLVKDVPRMTLEEVFEFQDQVPKVPESEQA